MPSIERNHAGSVGEEEQCSTSSRVPTCVCVGVDFVEYGRWLAASVVAVPFEIAMHRYMYTFMFFLYGGFGVAVSL